MSHDIELKSHANVHNPYDEDILQEQIKVDAKQASILSAFSFATRQEKIIVIANCVGAFIAGICQVLPTVIFGLIAGTFLEVRVGDEDDILGGITTDYILAFVWIAIGAFFAHFLATAGFVYTGDAITARIRKQFLDAILKQNIGFFDGDGRTSLVSQLTSNSDDIREGISQKLSLTVSAIGTLLGTLVVGFVLNPRLTGIAVWSIIATFVLAAGANFVAIVHGTRADEVRTKSLNLVEESLRAIRSVIALTAEKDILAKFRDLNTAAAASGYRLRSLVGAVIGSAVAIGYLSVALVLWQGYESIRSGTATYSQVIAIALLFKSAAFAVLGLGAHIEVFTKAGNALGKMISIITREQRKDKHLLDRIPDKAFTGSISFNNVRFIYPTRANAVIFDGLNLRIAGTKMTTLVGASGSGKSAIVDMLLGFYPILNGSIKIGDLDIQSIPSNLLLTSIRVVSQDPVLFEEMTIFENIILGLEATKRHELSAEQLMKVVEQACHIAEAHTFILMQRQGYSTMLGSHGETLSGGERQRIALARALINNPPILILDEATSALDNATESRVLENIRKWQKDRATVINISHRLYSAKLADEVVVLRAGRVLERGNYNDLLRSKTSSYFRFLTAQEDTEPTQPVSDLRPGTASTFGASTLRPMESMSSLVPLVTKAHSEKPGTRDLLSKTALEKNRTLKSLLAFVWSTCRPDWIYISVGAIVSVIAGFEEPISAVLFAYAIVGLANNKGLTTGPSIGTISLGFLALALGQCLMFILQAAMFARAAENMVFRTRNFLLEGFLARDVAFYEQDTTSVSEIVKIIFEATESMTGFSGSILGSVITGTGTIVAAFVLACAFGWQMALVCSVTIPVIVAFGIWGIYLVEKLKTQIEQHQVKSAQIGSEIILKVKTVVAFGLQHDVSTKYTDALGRAHKESLRTNLRLSLIYAGSQAPLYLCMSLGFWYGAKLIYAGTYTVFQVVLVYSLIIMSAYSAAVVFSFATDLGKAKAGTAAVMQALQQDSIRNWNHTAPSGGRPSTGPSSELLEMKNVCFAYPSRPHQCVLQNINLQLSKGRHIAIVGQTGSGKSTLLSLLARFHESDAGTFSYDGRPVQDVDMKTYRQATAIVTQDSILFEGSIQENLVLGLSVKPNSDQIRAACEDACIWEMVQSLPDGLETAVGAHGTALSGGQRQRLSIARALLRDARILLLDEATSALDLRTESMILDNLERSKKDRAIISVSHRQEVTRRADEVYVLKDGMICEKGDYSSLMARKGIFWAISDGSLPSEGIPQKVDGS